MLILFSLIVSFKLLTITVCNLNIIANFKIEDYRKLSSPLEND